MERIRVAAVENDSLIIQIGFIKSKAHAADPWVV